MGLSWLPLCLAFVICTALVNFSGEITPRGPKESGLLKSVFWAADLPCTGPWQQRRQQCPSSEQQYVPDLRKILLGKHKAILHSSPRYEATISPELGCSPDPHSGFAHRGAFAHQHNSYPSEGQTDLLGAHAVWPPMEHSGYSPVTLMICSLVCVSVCGYMQQQLTAAGSTTFPSCSHRGL